MNRRELRACVWPLWRQPTEAEWEDLEARIERVRREVGPIATDREMMGSRPGLLAIMEWRRAHKLLDTDKPGPL